MEPTHAISVPTPAPRADLLAELGLGVPTAGPSEPAGHPGAHARPAAAPVLPLDVLADIAGVSLTSLEFVRTDDRRASLTGLCTTLGWSNGTELVAFTDVATRRLWLQPPSTHACDCPHCEPAEPPPPAPAFTLAATRGLVQSKCRLLLAPGLWSSAGVAAHGGIALAAALPTVGALLLTGATPLLGLLLDDTALPPPAPRLEVAA